MAVRRLWYLVALLGGWVFYIFYGEWFSWVLLLLLLGLPWLSLAVSLPAMLTLKLSPSGPARLPLGQSAQLMILGSCSLPLPPFRGKLRMTGCLNGESQLYEPEKGLCPRHCGGILISVEKARVYDYLGLFSLRVRKTEQQLLLVPPLPLEEEIPERLHRTVAQSWRPKAGGGFSEHHELRLYRPGDSLNQVHWKLTAKTGQLILRESMEPNQGMLLLTMTLRGDPEQLDRKFGRLLWLGNYLLEQDLPWELRVLTGKGLEAFSLRSAGDLAKAMDSLLCSPAAQSGSIEDYAFAAAWQHHIGGDADAE